MDHSREEISGLQGNGHNSLRKSPNLEDDPTHGSSDKVRCTPELQRGDFKYFEIHDDLEARMGGFQRPFEEDGMEYDRHSLNEY